LYKFIDYEFSVKFDEMKKRNDLIYFFSIFINELKNKFKTIKIIILAYEETQTFDYSALDGIDGVTVFNLQDILPDCNLTTDEKYQIEDRWHPNGKAWDLITPKIAEIINNPRKIGEEHR